MIDVERLPLDDATRAVAAALGADPLAWATGGGEDYELLVACEPAALRAAAARAWPTRSAPPSRRSARSRPAPAPCAGRSRGREVTVARGFEHFAARPAASGAGA